MEDPGKRDYEKGGVGSNPSVVRMGGGWEHNCDNKRPLNIMKEEHMPLSALQPLCAGSLWGLGRPSIHLFTRAVS